MTVETNHANFLSKLNIVGKALTIVKTYGLEPTKLGYVIGIYNNIRHNYEMDVVDILLDYYSSTDSNDEYELFITSRNYNGKLTQCMDLVKTIQEHTNNTELLTLVKKFNRSKTIAPVAEIKYDICACGGEMVVFPNTSEMVCNKCGNVLVLHGAVFEDEDYYNQEGNRTKHGCYDPVRHCKFWINSIQAMENTEIPKELIEQVVKCIKRDGIVDCRRLLCSQLRLYLKETRNTDYNDHVPLLRKIITGIAPPQLKHDELRRLHNLFDKAVNAFEEVKPDDKSNTIYYPYIIYKILDFILKNGMRKKRILECIHLQSRDTLIANDNLWESICDIITELDYKPTDRNSNKINV